MTTKEFTGDVDLQAQLERFYQDGQLAQAAVVAWMLSALKPDSPDWKIYRKKLLRETGAEGASVTEIVSASDQAFDSQQPSDGFAALALGLLAQPENSPLLKKMLDRARAFEQRNFITAALIQLKEEQTDPEVLNVLGAMAQEAERYEEAERFFKKLAKLKPKSITAKLNWTAALTGLNRYGEAITELEWIVGNTSEKKEALFRLLPLFRLDNRSVYPELQRISEAFFSAPTCADDATIKALILTAMNEPEKAVAAYELSLSMCEDPTIRFDMALLQLRLGDYESGFANYRARFSSVNNIYWITPSGARWAGEVINDKSLLIWAEQGVGDEIFFGFMLDPVRERCNDVLLVVDERLVAAFSQRFPDWKVISRPHALKLHHQGELATDYELPMGELMSLFYDPKGRVENQNKPFFKVNPEALKQQREKAPPSNKLRVAISWEGGTVTDGKTRSMTLEDMLSGLPSNIDIDVISVQYTEGSDEQVLNYGDPRVRPSGLDNRSNLAGVMALLSDVDAVISVDNTVMHLAEAIGAQSYVLIPSALSQFRLKNPDFRRQYFSRATIFERSEDQGWSEIASKAWNLLLANLA